MVLLPDPDLQLHRQPGRLPHRGPHGGTHQLRGRPREPDGDRVRRAGRRLDRAVPQVTQYSEKALISTFSLFKAPITAFKQGHSLFS